MTFAVCECLGQVHVYHNNSNRNICGEWKKNTNVLQRMTATLFELHYGYWGKVRAGHVFAFKRFSSWATAVEIRPVMTESCCGNIKIVLAASGWRIQWKKEALQTFASAYLLLGRPKRWVIVIPTPQQNQSRTSANFRTRLRNHYALSNRTKNGR